MDEIGEKIRDNSRKQRIHRILAHSYAFYFGFLLLGLVFDFLFPLRLFKHPILTSVGFLIIILASMLIFWAQKTSRNLSKEVLTKEAFLGGPYRLSRSPPTHWGLFLLILGFGLIVNASFIVILSFFSFFITKVVFLRKEEEILEEKYGRPYREYKKMIRL